MLLLAFVASKSCASRDTEVDKDDAIAIARGEIDYEPERVVVRFVPRGIQSRPYWAVSLSTLDAFGNPQRVTVVLVNARTGDVEGIEEEGV